jgi:hypothetical protein
MAKLLKVWRFKGAKEFTFLFLYFLLVLLFCRLLWSDLGEPVSMMERNHGCSMDTHYELCESRLYKRISAELSGEQSDEEKGNIYDLG